MGKNFGLVTDTEDLIFTEACRRKANLPKSLTVYVEENTDENRCTMFNVYALDLIEKDIVRHLTLKSNVYAIY